MSAEPISMREWLDHASPNSPLEVLRDEARKLVEDAVSFEQLLQQVREEAGWMDAHFDGSNERHQYAGDES